MIRVPLIRTVFASVLLACCVFAASSARADRWPRELDTEKGLLTIYQPQPEKLSGNILSGRAAVSLVPKGKDKPIFGVFWFSGRLDTDRDADSASIRDIVVTNSRWPESSDSLERVFSAFLSGL